MASTGPRANIWGKIKVKARSRLNDVATIRRRWIKKEERRKKKKKRKIKPPPIKGANRTDWGSHFGLVHLKIVRKWIFCPGPEWVTPPGQSAVLMEWSVGIPTDPSLSARKNNFREGRKKELHCTFNYFPEINRPKPYLASKSPSSSTSLPCIHFIVQYTPTRSNFQGFPSTKLLWKHPKWHFPGKVLLNSEPDS